MRGWWLGAAFVSAGCGQVAGDVGQGGTGDPTGTNPPSASAPDGSTGEGVSSPGTVDVAPMEPPAQPGTCENPLIVQGTLGLAIDPSLPEMTAPAPFDDVTRPTLVVLWTPEGGYPVSQVWASWNKVVYATGIIYSGACDTPDPLGFSATFEGPRWGGHISETPFDGPIYFGLVHDGDHWPVAQGAMGGVRLSFTAADQPPPLH